MVKSTLKRSVYGNRRVIEGYPGHARLFVKRTNVKTYVVSTSEQLTLDSMVMINGGYHFDTLKELHVALNSNS